MKMYSRSLAMMVALVVSACGDDDDKSVEDASQPNFPADSGSADRMDATVDASSPPDAGAAMKAACDLLSASEVAAIVGVPQKATSLSGGLQCEYASTDTTKKDARALLEIVANGRAIYAGTLQMYADSGKTTVPQAGIADQAAFFSESMVRSSMMCTVGDTYLRLNIGWSDPGVASDTQLAGERSLLSQAVGRL